MPCQGLDPEPSSDSIPRMRGTSPGSFPAFRPPASSHYLVARRSSAPLPSCQSIFAFKSITLHDLPLLTSTFSEIKPHCSTLPLAFLFEKTLKPAFKTSLLLLPSHSFTGLRNNPNLCPAILFSPLLTSTLSSSLHQTLCCSPELRYKPFSPSVPLATSDIAFTALSPRGSSLAALSPHT